MAEKQNRLNDLTGSEWLYWTDTMYVTNYPPDVTHAMRKAHGAMKPPEVMAEIIRFFTKQREMVLDPMAGVGGTLLGAALTGRKSLGFELNPDWVAVYEVIKREFVVSKGQFVVPFENSDFTENRSIDGDMRCGDCLELIKEIQSASIDAVITDPPYGCNHRVTFAKETNFSMFNRDDDRDFGNAPDFDDYLNLMRLLGQEVYRVLKPDRYFVLMVGDRYHNGEYLPVGHLVAQEMRAVGFKFKGIKIWSNKATQRRLKPYAVKTCFVPNITHQNIIILRKEI